MILYGKKKNNDSYGFYTEDEKNDMEVFIELTDEEHSALISEANTNNKVIKPDSDGKPTLADIPEPTDKEKVEIEITELKDYLSSTDYVVLKIAEGVATKDEYTDVIQKRQKARNRINELENS